MRELFISLAVALCGTPVVCQSAPHELGPALGHPDAQNGYAVVQVLEAYDGLGLKVLIGGSIEAQIQVPIRMPRDRVAQNRINAAWQQACYRGLSIIVYPDGGDYPTQGSTSNAWPVFNTASVPFERAMTPIHTLVAQGVVGVDPRAVPAPFRESLRAILYESVREGAGFWADVQQRGEALWIVQQSGLSFKPYSALKAASTAQAAPMPEEKIVWRDPSRKETDEEAAARLGVTFDRNTMTVAKGGSR